MELQLANVVERHKNDYNTTIAYKQHMYQFKGKPPVGNQYPHRKCKPQVPQPGS